MLRTTRTKKVTGVSTVFTRCPDCGKLLRVAVDYQENGRFKKTDYTFIIIDNINIYYQLYNFSFYYPMAQARIDSEAAEAKRKASQQKPEAASVVHDASAAENTGTSRMRQFGAV